MMIIGRIINMKYPLKWSVHVDLSLHLSPHDGNRGVVQILVLLLLVICVCCRIGIASNDINPVESYLLKYLCEELLNNTIRCFHCLLLCE